MRTTHEPQRTVSTNGNVDDERQLQWSVFLFVVFFCLTPVFYVWSFFFFLFLFDTLLYFFLGFPNVCCYFVLLSRFLFFYIFLFRLLFTYFSSILLTSVVILFSYPGFELRFCSSFSIAFINQVCIWFVLILCPFVDFYKRL